MEWVTFAFLTFIIISKTSDKFEKSAQERKNKSQNFEYLIFKSFIKSHVYCVKILHLRVKHTATTYTNNL